MSLQAIAKSAGVSKSTVSRVINGKPGVRPEVVEAVRNKIQSLGYKPSVLRRSTQSTPTHQGIRTGNILMLTVGYGRQQVYRMPVFPTLLHGVERAVREAGLNLILAGIDSDGSSPASFSSSNVDGVLLFMRSPSLPAPIRQRLEGLPLVRLLRGQCKLMQPTDSVVYNNQAIGHMAADYLIDRGHRTLAYLNVAATHEAFATRQKQFLLRADERDASVSTFLAPHDADHVHSELTRQLVREFVRHEGERPTGIFVPTDTFVPDVYVELEANGITPGHDVEIVSCDYQRQFLDIVDPAPATIDINMSLLAKRGVEQLLWRIGHPDEQCHITILVEPRLIVPEQIVAATKR